MVTVRLPRHLTPRSGIDPLKDAKISAEKAYSHALSSGMPRQALIFKHAASQIIEHGNPLFFDAIGRMKTVPVTIDEFVESKEFLAGVEYDIWPTLRQDLRDMNPDVLIGEAPITQSFLGGATGTGKTHLSLGSIAHATYFLTCFTDPQRLFGLTPMTTLVGMMHSVSPTLTKRVLYTPFRKLFTGMEYVQKYVPWDRKIERFLALEGNIQIVPAAASLQAILGQAVIMACIDEANFMATVENSKMVAGPQGLGGYFDQAEELFSNLERRRARSFTTRGVSIGQICTVSSTRYKMDFLDRKIEEMDRIFLEEPKGTPKPYLVFRHKQYEVNPRFTEGKYPTFKLLVGCNEYGSRVLEDWEKKGVHYPEDGYVIQVPLPYKVQFKKDPDAALRDVVGMATDAITPFFRKRVKIAEAMQRGAKRGLKKWTEKDLYELAEDGMPEWLEDNLPKSKEIRQRAHFIHVDLSKNKDTCGIGVVRHDGFLNQETDNGIEVLPKLTVVAAIGIQPNVVHELDIAAVRSFCLKLVKLGVNIKSITFDGFASQESIQMLRKVGIHSEVISVDRPITPYEDARDIIYQDRLDIQPDCALLQVEANTVEYFPVRDKVDHPPKGTKDVLDGVVGAITAALRDRTIRSLIVATDDEGERQVVDRPTRRKGVLRRRVVVR